MSRPFIALRTAFYATAFVATWAWLAALVRPLDADLGVAIPHWARWIGLAVALAGAALGVSCLVWFVRQGRGTAAPFDPPRELVAGGPYRWVRNPMYLGGAGVLLGCGLALGSPAIVLLAATFCGIAHVFVVLYEEPTLGRRFGASYQRYRRSVRRWLPRRPPVPPG